MHIYNGQGTKRDTSATFQLSPHQLYQLIDLAITFFQVFLPMKEI